MATGHSQLQGVASPLLVESMETGSCSHRFHVAKRGLLTTGSRPSGPLELLRGDLVSGRFLFSRRKNVNPVQAFGDTKPDGSFFSDLEV